MANILKEANEIINERSEEKERQYGPIGEGLERAAKIASGMTGKDFEADDIFAVLIAHSSCLFVVSRFLFAFFQFLFVSYR